MSCWNGCDSFLTGLCNLLILACRSSTDLMEYSLDGESDEV